VPVTARSAPELLRRLPVSALRVVELAEVNPRQQPQLAAPGGRLCKTTTPLVEQAAELHRLVALGHRCRTRTSPLLVVVVVVVVRPQPLSPGPVVVVVLTAPVGVAVVPR
jgi:hypothetical protein